MSAPWPAIRLGEAGEWLSGGTPAKARDELWAGPVPWVSPKDMKRPRIGDAEDHVSTEAAGQGTQLVPPDTLLMVVRGMILAHTFPVAVTTAPVTFNQDIKALRPRRDIDASYLLFWLQSMQRDVLRLVDVANHGTKRLPTERLLALDLPLPPLAEQRRIAAVLGAVDDVIASGEAVVEQLDRVRRDLAEDLLRHGLPGSRHRLRETDIGKIPEGWGLKALSQVGQVQTGLAKGKVAAGDTVELPYLRVANVQDGHVDLDEMKTVVVQRSAVDRYRLRDGDVLFTEGGDFDKLGRGCVWRGQIDPCLHQNHVFAVRTGPELHPGFLAAHAASKRGRAYFLDCAKRTTNLASINSTQLKALPVPIPPLDEQQAIVDALAAVSDRVDKERVVLAERRRLKTALADALLTGQIRVPPTASV